VAVLAAIGRLPPGTENQEVGVVRWYRIFAVSEGCGRVRAQADTVTSYPHGSKSAGLRGTERRVDHMAPMHLVNVVVLLC